MKFVPDGPIDINLSLVKVTAWYLAGTTSLTEPKNTDAYMRHQASMSWCNGFVASQNQAPWN